MLIMKIKPFVNINFCYKCGCPVPRVSRNWL